MKINSFWGELNDNSAIKEALTPTSDLVPKINFCFVLDLMHIYLYNENKQRLA